MRQTRHHSRSVAVGSAWAFCAGVIVFRTIPTSHLKKIRNVRWSGSYTLNGCKFFLN
ncbi:hypothetical protein BN844_4649 [Pseudomonas sp. SHC52]|nr:hypothetical protein BN844_4649 [Pseudomonas sp. SHC52]